MAVEVWGLVEVLVRPPFVVLASCVVVEEGFLHVWSMRQGDFASFPRGVGEELPHILERFGDSENPFGVVA